MKKITLLVALLAINFSNGQWTMDTAANTLVADSNTDDAKAIGTSDGKTFIVFWKVVAAPTNYELRAQLLDAAGNRLFGNDGMLISNTIPMSTSTVTWKLATDNADNLYVAVTGTGAGIPALVFKIDTTGANLWGASGLSIGSGYVPTVLPLSDGDVMISYMPTSGKAKLQRYTSAGVPVWSSAVDIVGGSASANTVPADMFELSDGGITMVFHQRAGFGVASTLFAQRYNVAGAPQWTTSVQLSNKGTAYNAVYSSAKDGDVVFYGYSASTVSRFDGFVQRINSDGTLPWGINGIDFDTNETSYEMDTKIAFAEGAVSIWAIARYTPSTQDLYGEYVQKFDKETGARLFGDNAKMVFPIDNNYRNHAGDLHLVNNQPLFLVRNGLDTGASPVTLNMVLLDSDGNPAFTPAMLPVATFSASKGRVALARPVNGQAVAVFTEQKTSGQNKIYAQKFSDALLATQNHAVSKNRVTIYPNPSAGQVNFKISAENLGSTIQIFNVTGQLIKNCELEAEITPMLFNKGFYIVKLTKDGIHSTGKFIVE